MQDNRTAGRLTCSSKRMINEDTHSTGFWVAISSKLGASSATIQQCQSAIFPAVQRHLPATKLEMKSTVKARRLGAELFFAVNAIYSLLPLPFILLLLYDLYPLTGVLFVSISFINSITETSITTHSKLDKSHINFGEPNFSKCVFN